MAFSPLVMVVAADDLGLCRIRPDSGQHCVSVYSSLHLSLGMPLWSKLSLSYPLGTSQAQCMKSR